MRSSPLRPLMVSFWAVPNSVSGPVVPFTVAATATAAAQSAMVAASATINLSCFMEPLLVWNAGGRC